MSEQDGATQVEESPVWEAADRLRHHGFPWLAELVEEMARERAKRPDREQFYAEAWSHLGGPPVAAYMAGVDAVLSSLALEPEAREEPVSVARVLHALASLAEEVIHNGDVAEVVAMPPGTTGLAAAVDARDSLYEEPAAWIRDQVDKLHQILPAPEAREVTDVGIDAARAVITALAPYNMELRPDGSEDREAAAYVSGVQAASDAIPEALRAAWEVRSRA